MSRDFSPIPNSQGFSVYTMKRILKLICKEPEYPKQFGNRTATLQDSHYLVSGLPINAHDNKVVSVRGYRCW